MCFWFLTSMMFTFRALSRKKLLTPPGGDKSSQTQEALGVVELTCRGIGGALGVAIYILLEHTFRFLAGPAVILSVLIAAFTAFLAGLCFAELGARIPQPGSAYVYSYVTVGEFIAFVTGWTMVLQSIVGCSFVARGLTVYIDTLVNGTLKEVFQSAAPLNVNYMSPYFDFLAFTLSILVSVILALGSKSNSISNKLYTIFSLAAVVFTISVGATGAIPSNWITQKDNIPGGAVGGDGGFAPFGVVGVFKGAAICLYGFVGIDNISTTGKKIKAPQSTFPIAVTLSVLIVFLACIGVSIALSFACQYYERIEMSLLPHMVEKLDLPWAWWTVTLCAMFCLLAGIFTALNPLRHLLPTLAADGLLFTSMGSVHHKFHTPLIGLLLSGLLSALMAALFELSILVEMTSIATLVVYAMLAACMLLLRYCEGPSEDYQYITQNSVESIRLVPFHEKKTPVTVLKQLINKQKPSLPTPVSSTIVAAEILLYCVLAVAFGVALQHIQQIWAIITSAITASLAGLILFCIYIQPMATKSIPFKVPWIPAVPGLSILINICLACTLSYRTLIHYAVWMFAGLLLYFLYGVRNSRGIYVMECCVIQEPEIRIVIEGPSAQGSRSQSQLVGLEIRNQGSPFAVRPLKSAFAVSEEIVSTPDDMFHSESSTDYSHDSTSAVIDTKALKDSTPEQKEPMMQMTSSFLHPLEEIKLNPFPVNLQENATSFRKIQPSNFSERELQINEQVCNEGKQNANNKVTMELQVEVSHEKEQCCEPKTFNSALDPEIPTGEELSEKGVVNAEDINKHYSESDTRVSIRVANVPCTNGNLKRSPHTSDHHAKANGVAKKFHLESDVKSNNYFELRGEDSMIRKNKSSFKRPFSLPNDFNEHEEESGSNEMKDKERIKLILEAMLSARVSKNDTSRPRNSNSPFQTKPTLTFPRQAFSVPSFPLLVNGTKSSSDPLPELTPSQSSSESPVLVTSSSPIPPPPPLPPPLPPQSLQIEPLERTRSVYETQSSVNPQERNSAVAEKTFIPVADFEHARKQRILMGDMLASIKFLKRRELIGGLGDEMEKGINCDNESDDDDDVFESSIKGPKKPELILSEEQELQAVV